MGFTNPVPIVSDDYMTCKCLALLRFDIQAELGFLILSDKLWNESNSKAFIFTWIEEPAEIHRCESARTELKEKIFKAGDDYFYDMGLNLKVLFISSLKSFA